MVLEVVVVVVRVVEVDPPELRLRVAWVRIVEGPVGDAVALREMVPEKLFMLASWI